MAMFGGGGIMGAVKKGEADKENALDCVRLLMAMDEGRCTEEDLLMMVEDDIQDGDGIDLNQRDMKSWTPLHWAASDGLLLMCKKLCDYKAFPNAKDQFGATPLHLAAFNGHRDVVEYICGKVGPTNVDAHNNFAATPLHYAAQRGRLGCIEALVLAKADLAAEDRSGETALVWAAKRGGYNSCVTLCQLKADPLQDNNASEDAIESAEASGHEECVAVLRKAAGNEKIRTARQLGEWLIFHYGSLEEGWKVRLDMTGDGTISWVEFCRACRNIGLVDDPHPLWQELDDDESGVISMKELADETSGQKHTKGHDTIFEGSVVQKGKKTKNTEKTRATAGHQRIPKKH